MWSTTRLRGSWPRCPTSEQRLWSSPWGRVLLGGVPEWNQANSCFVVELLPRPYRTALPQVSGQPHEGPLYLYGGAFYGHCPFGSLQNFPLAPSIPGATQFVLRHVPTARVNRLCSFSKSPFTFVDEPSLFSWTPRRGTLISSLVPNPSYARFLSCTSTSCELHCFH